MAGVMRLLRSIHQPCDALKLLCLSTAARCCYPWCSCRAVAIATCTASVDTLAANTSARNRCRCGRCCCHFSSSVKSCSCCCHNQQMYPVCGSAPAAVTAGSILGLSLRTTIDETQHSIQLHACCVQPASPIQPCSSHIAPDSCCNCDRLLPP
jgi:hypothetical protein